jgi:HTH-type transcriptional regulator/antitoxin HigA
MNWKIIKSEEEHVTAVKRMIEIFHAEPNTPEDEELQFLAQLVKDYEDKKFPMPEPNAEE